MHFALNIKCKVALILMPPSTPEGQREHQLARDPSNSVRSKTYGVGWVYLASWGERVLRHSSKYMQRRGLCKHLLQTPAGLALPVFVRRFAETSTAPAQPTHTQVGNRGANFRSSPAKSVIDRRAVRASEICLRAFRPQCCSCIIDLTSVTNMLERQRLEHVGKPREIERPRVAPAYASSRRAAQNDERGEGSASESLNVPKMLERQRLEHLGKLQRRAT